MPGSERALVVGADGFLGRNLVLRLQAEGRAVVGIGRADGDLSDWATVERMFRAAPPVGRIFHVATRQRTGAVQYDIQGELLAINARIHLNVLDAWRLFQPQAKLVSTGSSCTYPDSAEPLAETRFGQGPTHPSVIGYGLAKQVLATGSAAYAHQYGLRFLHCVLATLYGPHDHTAPDRSHFVGALLDRAVREMASGATEFAVWGNPQTVREVLHVEDQIDAILAADQAFDNVILNCAANAPVTVETVARAVLAALDWSVPLVCPPGSFQGAAHKVLDSTRFLDRTGWRPRIALETGLRRLAAATSAGPRSRSAAPHQAPPDQAPPYQATAHPAGDADGRSAPTVHARSVHAANAAVQRGDLAAAKAQYGAAWRSADVGTLVIGDSHVFTFLDAGHVLPVWLGSVTMHRVGRDGTALLALSDLAAEPGLDVVFSFGEIDARVHLARQARKQAATHEAVSADLVDRYLDALVRICDRPGLRVFVATPVPPQDIPAESPHAGPDLPTLAERIALSRILATRLAAGVRARGLRLIDLHGGLCGPDGAMRPGCGSDGIHAYTPMGRRIAADLLRVAQGGAWTRAPRTDRSA